MAISLNIDQQLKKLHRKIDANVKRAGRTALMRTANKLVTMAAACARDRSFTDPHGKHVPQWIKKRVSSPGVWPPYAIVFLNTAEFPHIAYDHENYHGYTIKPKVTKFLFIPLTSKGRRHTLHAHDSAGAGWLVDGEKSRPVGNWSGIPKNKPVKDVELDFILKKSAWIPKNPRAGYLTGTAKREKSTLIAYMSGEFKKELNKL